MAQTRLIRWIAQGGGVVMVTNTVAGKCYTPAYGRPANRQVAEGVLPHLIARKDGPIDLNPQRWRVRTPGDQ